MHIPLTRHEIADFLETTSVEVEHLWASGKLKRSQYNDIRPIAALAQSSIFDVAEYTLASDHLFLSLAPAEAAMWTLYLCELCECEDWDEWTQQDRAENILACAADDGLANIEDMNAARTAATVIMTHTTLMNICQKNNR